MNTIKFYSVNQPFGEFSNFSQHPIRINGIQYPTVEHFFQSQKFKGKSYETKIIKAKTAMKAAELGRSRRVKIVDNWDKKKDNIMFQGVLTKFKQHTDLREFLLKTGNSKLIEHTENDSYWGDGGNGNGLNKLGKILMKVRTILKEENESMLKRSL